MKAGSLQGNGQRAAGKGTNSTRGWRPAESRRLQNERMELTVQQTLTDDLTGFEIADAIQRHSGYVLTVEEGSLYPALQRMLVQGWVAAEWGTTAGNRRARYYELTKAGRRQLDVEMSQFERVNTAIWRVLQVDDICGDDAAPDRQTHSNALPAFAFRSRAGGRDAAAHRPA
jgi:PadR family transcriptional regulator PadR